MNTKTPDQETPVANQPVFTDGGGQQMPTLDKEIYRAEAHIKQLTELKELREVARPLIEYLKNKYHPQTRAIVHSHGVVVVEDLVSVQL